MNDYCGAQKGPLCSFYSALMLIFGLLALAGCASDPVRAPLPRVVRIEIPVILPCPVGMPAVAPYATDLLTKDASDFDKIRGLLVERRQRAGTEEDLRKLLDVCIKD